MTEATIPVNAIGTPSVSRFAGILRSLRRSPAGFIGFVIVVTDWFYLYLPWFFPFVALALVAPLPGRADDGGARAAV